MTVSDFDDPRVKTYLADLRRALRPLPRARRREIEDEVRGHIGAELADAPADPPWAVETVLGRLGPPEEIAATAMQDTPPVRGRIGWRQITITVLLLVGGVVLPFIGWVIGVALLWTSDAWRLRDKLVGTLLVPGGLLGTVLLGVGSIVVGSSGAVTECTIGTAVSSGGSQRPSAQHCVTTSTSTGGLPTWLVASLLVVVVIGPFVTFGWLLWQANREPRSRREPAFEVPLGADA